MSLLKNFNKKNIVCALWLLISIVLSLLSVKATALNCPGPQDFIHKKGMLWGWSWGLRSSLTDFSRFTSFEQPVLSSPSEKEFSENFVLDVGLKGLTYSEAQLYCIYYLDDKDKNNTISVQTITRSLSKEEAIRITNTWKKTNWTFYNDQEPVYECLTTAGKADKCSVNFL